jgi:hypothetical protein
LQHFAAELFAREGALVEPIDPEGLEVLAPPSLQHAVDLPELSRLGFGAEVPAGAQRCGLDSDWMERLAAVLAERGRWARRVLDAANPPPGDPERILAHGLQLVNATYRFSALEPAWTRYLILSFRYTALCDEKREGILRLGLNLSSGATLDDLMDRLWPRLAEADGAAPATPPADAELPALWERRRLLEVLERTLKPQVRRRLVRFLEGMRRRLERDQGRLHGYYGGLRAEALARLAALPGNGDLSARQAAAAERERLRLDAIAREHQAKLNDLRHKFAMTVTVQWSQTLELVMPVHRFEIVVRRRKRERLVTLDWNPLARGLEPAPCEYSHTVERPRLVCDEALHLVHPTAHAACGGCGKPYCRACHRRQCPRCGRQPAVPASERAPH